MLKISNSPIFTNSGLKFIWSAIQSILISPPHWKIYNAKGKQILLCEDLVFQPPQTACFLLCNYKAFSRIAEVNVPAAARAYLCVISCCKKEKFWELVALEHAWQKKGVARGLQAGQVSLERRESVEGFYQDLHTICPIQWSSSLAQLL